MPDNISSNRKKRIRILKKLIVACLLAAILIPTVVSICLGLKVKKLKGQMEELQKEALRMEAAVEEMQTKAAETQNRRS